jgi:TrmH family RNA methyltransferase
MLVKSKVKYIQSLSHKKQREQDRVFIAEGPKIINELLNEGAFEPIEIFALKEWLEHHSDLKAIPFTEIDEVMLSRLSALSTPNQVVGLFRMPPALSFSPVGKLSLLLDGIQDPGNLGTIVRCADWFGITDVMCSEDCVDVFNPKCIQSTMGSIARVNVFYGDLEEIIQKYQHVTTYAAVLDGEDINEVSRLTEAMILIGNESKGIREQLLRHPHRKITINKKGRAESLNAAVATGIILHAMAG